MGGARPGFRAPPDFQLSNLNPKNIPAMNPKSLLSCLFGITLAGIPAARATLAITNGDFQTGAPAGDSGDVLNWNDANPGNFWEAAWLKNGGDSPNGSAVMAMSAIAANETPNGAGTNAYAYQAIGTRDWSQLGDDLFPVGQFHRRASARPRHHGRHLRIRRQFCPGRWHRCARSHWRHLGG